MYANGRQLSSWTTSCHFLHANQESLRLREFCLPALILFFIFELIYILLSRCFTSLGPSLRNVASSDFWGRLEIPPLLCVISGCRLQTQSFAGNEQQANPTCVKNRPAIKNPRFCEANVVLGKLPETFNAAGCTLWFWYPRHSQYTFWTSNHWIRSQRLLRRCRNSFKWVLFPFDLKEVSGFRFRIRNLGSVRSSRSALK